jgi:hypothetical protein
VSRLNMVGWWASLAESGSGNVKHRRVGQSGFGGKVVGSDWSKAGYE